MSKSNSKRIEKVGSVAECSDRFRIPPPKRLIGALIYKQAPGRHPGQPLGSQASGKATLEEGKELVELVTAGRGWIKTKEGEWKEVTPGALIWHIPGDQTIARSDWENPYQCLVLAFEAYAPQGQRRAVRLSWWRDMDEVERFSREVTRWYRDDRFNRETLLHYAYARLLFQSERWQQTEEHSELPPKLRQAAEWMTQHCTEVFSMRAVAQMVGWSVPHFHEVFRAKLDATPHQFVLERRIRVAKERLAVTDEPIKRLAAYCGFSNTAVFCHAFKARVGITPLSYRRQEREWMGSSANRGQSRSLK